MDESRKRFELAEISFKSVLDEHHHQDEKAGRILSAMAFITAAIIGVFNFINTIPRVHFSLLPGLDWLHFCLYAYLFCVLLGSAFYLLALVPYFVTPPGYLSNNHINEERESRPKLPSLLFFPVISSLSKVTWFEYWNKNPDALQDEITENYINETLLISRNLATKLKLMTWGSSLFKIALFFFSAIIAHLFASEVRWFYLFTFLSLVALTLIIYLERKTIKKWSRPKS